MCRCSATPQVPSRPSRYPLHDGVWVDGSGPEYTLADQKRFSFHYRVDYVATRDGWRMNKVRPGCLRTPVSLFSHPSSGVKCSRDDLIRRVKGTSSSKTKDPSEFVRDLGESEENRRFEGLFCVLSVVRPLRAPWKDKTLSPR